MQVGERASRLANVLLDGLTSGVVRLWGVAAQRPEIVGEASKELQARPAPPLTRIEHRLTNADGTTSQGELHGWYLATVGMSSMEYGSNFEILIRPEQVVLRSPHANIELLS